MIKIAPETAIKLAFNDRIKAAVVHDREHITPMQRMVCGALAGAVAQVSLFLCSVLSAWRYPHLKKDALHNTAHDDTRAC